MATGKDTFQEFDIVEDSSAVIANLEESLLGDAAFFFSRTVWANLRVQKDDAGQYMLGVGGMSNGMMRLLDTDPMSKSGPSPVGYILDFPVYTSRHLPALSATAVSTKFGIFGNLRCASYAERGPMRMERYTSGTFGSKEIALADQQGIVMKQDHAVTLHLPEGFVTIATAAS